MQNIIPGFDRFEQIGEGLFAVVWKAHQISLDRMVAIKIIKPQFTSKMEEVKAFISEARAAAKLKHPNIVQVYDVAEQDGIYYFVMEYIAGATVARMISEEGSIPEKRALKIIIQVAEALEEAWEKGSLIHRNVSPRNILQDADGTVKLSDLGMSKLADFASATSQTGNVQVRGLCNYISPELALRSSQLDCRADMYSLGATLYHMVTGEMPFDICSPAQILNGLATEMIANPRDLKPGLSTSLVRLLTKLMMKDPKNRYRSWKEVLKDIGKVAGGYSIASPQIPGAASTIDNSQVASAQPAGIRIQPAAQVRIQPAAQIRIPSSARADAEEERTADTNAAPAATSAEKTGGRMRVPFWLAMLLFWAFLFLTLLRLPDLDYESIKPPIDEMILDDTPKNGTPVPEKPKATVEPGGSEYTPGVESTKPTGEKKPSEKPVAQEKPGTEQPPAVVATKPDNAVKLDSAMLKSITDSLIGEKFDAALETVKKAQSEAKLDPAAKTELDSLGKLVTEVSRMNIAVEKAFMDKSGADVEMKINGVMRPASIRAIIGGKVNVEYSPNTSAPAESYTFAINQMDPIEKSRWLGKMNSTSKFAMKYILLMKGRNYEAARDLADKCGPFADVFKTEAESKIPPPPAPKEKAGS